MPPSLLFLRAIFLDTDASDKGLGAVLSQVQGGNEHVIAYEACALSKVERNYSTTRKELLALLSGERNTLRHIFTADDFLLGLTIVLCSGYRISRTLGVRLPAARQTE